MTAVVATLVSLCLGVGAADPAHAATPPRISPLLFGMHETDLADAQFPSSRPGTVRLWDTGTQWRQVELNRGRYDFTVLDHAVATARANRSQALLVLGQTPRWASAKPNAASPYGAGASGMPKAIAYWREYVTAVVKRYRGRIKAYQIWNEPNVVTFWTGTPAQMVLLTKEAARIIHRYDPSATVVSPSFATRLRTNLPWMGQWLRAGGARYVDAIALHLYPLPSGGPETSMALLAKARAILRTYRVTAPIWNTEINYGAGVGGAPPRHYSAAAGAAYVARTYLLNAANGVARAYWYGWNTSGILGIKMTAGGLPTTPGTAYISVRKWMVGARLYGCTADRLHTTRCVLRYPGSWGLVVWNAHKAYGVRAPAGTVSVSFLDGTYRSARRGGRVQVSSVPVLIRTRVRPAA